MKKRKLSPAEIIQRTVIRNTKINIPYEFQQFSERIEQMERALESTIDPDEQKRKRKRYEAEIRKRKEILKRKINKYVKELERVSSEYAKKDLVKGLKKRSIPVPEKLKEEE